MSIRRRRSTIRIANLDLLRRINAVVPKRDGIISDMVEAVLAGRVPLNAITQSVVQFVRASYRMDHNKFGPSRWTYQLSRKASRR
ncbi:MULTISPECIES: hypothetical protein [unclassified Bradyrhizobium]